VTEFHSPQHRPLHLGECFSCSSGLCRTNADHLLPHLIQIKPPKRIRI
jgi:hypothetical protein